jgi:hypothetical protein
VSADINTHDIFAIKVKNGPQIVVHPYGINGLFVERREMMNFVGAQSWIKRIPLKKGKDSFGRILLL